MSALSVYHQVKELLGQDIHGQAPETSLKRLALLVTGMIRCRCGSPAQVAQGAAELGLSEATAESIERRVRRAENDTHITAETYVHPFARRHLLWDRPKELLLIMDPTLQEDRVVMITAAVWYRGRALPLAWSLWPANVPLQGPGFWERVAELLDRVATLLPDVPIVWLADRAFGCPAFIDLVVAHGWHYVVRVQGHTRYQDSHGISRPVRALVRRRGNRAKLRSTVFKKAGWREASVVVNWGRRHKQALCLVSDLPPSWDLIHLYRRRYPIEATFRDLKSYGWRLEQGQVTDLEHLERLLVAMALATWLALMVGSQVAAELLAKPPSGRRRTPPWASKYSLFQLGLMRLRRWLNGGRCELLQVHCRDWEAPNWRTQINQHHAHAFVFA